MHCCHIIIVCATKSKQVSDVSRVCVSVAALSFKRSSATRLIRRHKKCAQSLSAGFSSAGFQTPRLALEWEQQFNFNSHRLKGSTIFWLVCVCVEVGRSRWELRSCQLMLVGWTRTSGDGVLRRGCGDKVHEERERPLCYWQTHTHTRTQCVFREATIALNRHKMNALHEKVEPHSNLLCTEVLQYIFHRCLCEMKSDWLKNQIRRE